MIIINFKNYKTGKDVLKFAKKIDDSCFTAAVPALNIKEVSEKTKLVVFAQHVDGNVGGRGTGYLSAKAVKDAGASGTLLNHSEHQISMKELKETVKKCKKVGLKVVVCVANLSEVDKVKKLKPFAIAYEDPKLIAGKVSITSNPLPILKFVKKLSKTKIIPLCGAGINSNEDVENARKLGCKGVLIASRVMKDRNPGKFLRSIAK